MSKEAIRKIKDAEAEAKRIREEGAERAREILRIAEEEGARLCEESEGNAIRENRMKLDLTQEKVNDLLEKTQIDAKSEAVRMRLAGEDRMRDAVRMIVGGLYESCQ